MALGTPLGRVCNVIPAASGVTAYLTDYDTAMCITYEDDGSTIVTVTEVDSTSTNSEQALDVPFRPFKGPGVGGTWTAMTEQDDTVDLGDDGTNDAMILAVNSDQLSDGYDGVQFTADDGTCLVVLCDPKVKRNPANLRSTLTA